MYSKILGGLLFSLVVFVDMSIAIDVEVSIILKLKIKLLLKYLTTFFFVIFLNILSL